ncbi:Unknown protein, partial [Striga hermonthica]
PCAYRTHGPRQLRSPFHVHRPPCALRHRGPPPPRPRSPLQPQLSRSRLPHTQRPSLQRSPANRSYTWTPRTSLRSLRPPCMILGASLWPPLVASPQTPFAREAPSKTLAPMKSNSSPNLRDKRDLPDPTHLMAPTQATVVAQFRDYHAEKFSGKGDPRIVDEWIQGLEFIFEVMDCPDRYRVVCAQLQLTGDASLWWNAYWSMRPGEKAGCTWDMLKELVREKYYPSYYGAEMERQFLALQQGTRTVDEYEREFTRLAAFVPDLVRTEAQRAQRFIDGLYPAVRHNIVGHRTQTYARAVSIAQEVDASIRREAVRDRAQPSAPVQPFAAPPAQPVKEKKRKGKGAQTDRRTRQRQQPIPLCPTCGRLHRGECH